MIFCCISWGSVFLFSFELLFDEKFFVVSGKLMVYIGGCMIFRVFFKEKFSEGLMGVIGWVLLVNVDVLCVVVMFMMNNVFDV